MSQSLQAVYENGVLRLLEPISLSEHQRVTLTIEVPAEPWLDLGCLAAASQETDDNVSLEAVQQALSKIPGSLTPAFIAERDER
jgi:predicted DNA-binding antitoxin AbrB/MazE fold protein